jgi:hypothetical protein
MVKSLLSLRTEGEAIQTQAAFWIASLLRASQ